MVRIGDRRGRYKILVGKPEGKWSLERPSRRWDDNIKVDIQQLKCKGED